MAATLNFQAAVNNGVAFIRIAYQTCAADRRTKSTGYNIPNIKVKGKLKHWDRKKQRVVGHENAAKINQLLNGHQSAFDALVLKCNEQKRAVTLRELQDLFEEPGANFDLPAKKKPTEKHIDNLIESVLQGPVKLPKATNESRRKNDPNRSHFMKVWDMFEKAKALDIKKSAIKHYWTFRTQLEAFEDSRARPIVFAEINEDFYKEMALFFTKKLNNVNTTINRKIVRARTFILWAIDKGYADPTTCQKVIQLNKLKANKFPLTPIEQEQFKNFVPGTKVENSVYWGFLFALETGLRYSDVRDLKPRDIKEAIFEDGSPVKFLYILEFKTQEYTSIPLSNAALKILDQFDLTGPTVFNMPTNEEANRTLKDIARAQGMNNIYDVRQLQGKELKSEALPMHEILSFHYARYTYITQLLQRGLSPVHVQYNVGHNKIETTMDYNRTIDRERFEQTLNMQNKART